MTVRDSTRDGLAPASSVSPGRRVQLLVLRGAKERLVGAAEDQTLTGHADVEIRLFARFDPLTPDERRSRPMFGSSPHPPARRAESAPAADPFKLPPALFGMPPAGTGPPSARPPSITPAGTSAPRSALPLSGSSPATAPSFALPVTDDPR